MPETLAAVSGEAFTGAAAVAEVATVASVGSNLRAAQKTEEASRKQQQLARINRARERRQTIRKQIIAQSDLRNVAAQTGTAGSSGAQGAQQSIGSQAASGIAFLDAQGAFEESIGRANVQSARARTAGNIFATTANIFKK